jgi:DNA-binding IclR family transcriptional regulator
LTQTEIGERLGLARSTVHRILGALETEDLVVVSRSRGRYRIGPEISRMADAARRDLLDILHPYLHDLSRALGETADLSVLDGDRITFLDQVVAPQRLRAVSAIGESFPAYACAPGKAILADLPISRLRSAVPTNLVGLTRYTVSSFEDLQRELEEIRTTRVAFDREEHTEGICAVGVAIDLNGTPTAISVPLPVQRFYGREEEVARALRDCAADIVEHKAL